MNRAFTALVCALAGVAGFSAVASAQSGARAHVSRSASVDLRLGDSFRVFHNHRF